MSIRHSFQTFVLAAALVQAMTATASAQSVNTEPGDRIDIERAMRLEAEASSLFDQRNDLDKAARKLRAAARLRPSDDRRALQLLRRAGVLAFHATDFRASRQALLEQAERALSLGEVSIAAHAFIDAAFAAKELNDVAAFDYIERARLLSTSTLIAANERAILAKRIGIRATNAAEDATSDF